jgi:hypothetical protein
MPAAAQLNSGPRPPQGGHAAGLHSGLRLARLAGSVAGPAHKRRQAGVLERAQSAHDGGGARARRTAWRGRCRLVSD